MNSMKSISKTIRFPAGLAQELQDEADKNGRSFSSVVIDHLNVSESITVSEGAEICKQLLEINRLLSVSTDDLSVKDSIFQVLTQMASTLLKIEEKYYKEGHENGNIEID